MQSETSTLDFVFAQLERLTLSFPKTKLSEENLKAYAKALLAIDPHSLQRGIDFVIRSSKYFPAISEIINASRNPSSGEVSDTESRKKIRLHASMCSGMNEVELSRYFSDNHVSFTPEEMNYFRAIVSRAEEDRERILSQQWPNRKPQ